MRRQYAAITMYKTEFGILHLTRLRFTAQLMHRLDHVEHAAGRAGMSE